MTLAAVLLAVVVFTAAFVALRHRPRVHAVFVDGLVLHPYYAAAYADLVAIRMEERVALTIKRPEEFVIGVLA